MHSGLEKGINSDSLPTGPSNFQQNTWSSQVETAAKKGTKRDECYPTSFQNELQFYTQFCPNFTSNPDVDRVRHKVGDKIASFEGVFAFFAFYFWAWICAAFLQFSFVFFLFFLSRARFFFLAQVWKAPRHGSQLFSLWGGPLEKQVFWKYYFFSNACEKKKKKPKN